MTPAARLNDIAVRAVGGLLAIVGVSIAALAMIGYLAAAGIGSTRAWAKFSRWFFGASI